MLEPWQAALLRKKARALGVSESALLRAAVPTIASLESLEPIDERVWEQASDSFEGARQRRTNEIRRGWTRDELYEERFARWRLRPWIERILDDHGH